MEGHASRLTWLPTEAERARDYNGTMTVAELLAIGESPSKRVLLGAQNAREDLERGITTVRNLGHSGIDGDIALRDAINAGRVPGPRILASGRKLITRGSYVHNNQRSGNARMARPHRRCRTSQIRGHGRRFR